MNPGNHIWQSTLFALAAAVLAHTFRRNRASVRFWIWFAASAKFLIPISLLMVLGSRVEWPAAARHAAPPAVSNTIVGIAAPFAATSPPTISAPRADWRPAFLFTAWACGFAAIALLRLRGWLRVRALLRHSTPLPLALPVEVRGASGVLEPGVAGFFRPVLQLPAGILDRLTAEQMSAVLAHELCHVRRRDNLTAALHMLVEAVFWFHPLVWWIGARLVEERERACDEEVLRLGNQPAVYAESILTVCKNYLESPLPCVSGVTGADLKGRIRAILAGRLAVELTPARKAALAAAAAAAVLAPIFVGMLGAQTQGPKFEVASIKPCKPEDSGGKSGRKSAVPFGASSPGSLTTGCGTVESLIRMAYVSYATGHLNRDPSNPPIEGGPAWIRSDTYSVRAKAVDASSLGTMRGPMLRALLEDRFQLKLHRASREVPVYALTVAKDGPHLAAFEPGTCIPMDMTAIGEQDPQTRCRVSVGGKGDTMTLSGPGLTLDDLAKMLYLIVDRPVVNRTGVPGRFDIRVEFTPDGTPPAFRPNGDTEAPPPVASLASADDLSGPSIFTVLQRQLGLKLEASRGERDYIVIDTIKRPSGN